MKINVETLRDALEEMGKFREIYEAEKASGTPGSDIRIRAFHAAVVKAFEFTYESAIRLIRRQLSEGSFTTAEVKALAFRDMMHTAAESGLIADPKPWFHYRDIHNLTSDVYGKAKTDKALSAADDFLKDVHFLLAELVRRNSP